jgi:hypothetical protein
MDAHDAAGNVISGAVVGAGSLVEATDNGVLDIEATTIEAGATVKASGGGEIIMTGGVVAGGATFETFAATSNTISGVLVSGNAVVEAISGGTLYLDSATIGAGATAKASAGGELFLVGGTIDGGGTVETLSGGSAFFGNVTNSGTIFASGADSFIGFFGAISGGVTEVGNGTVELAGGEAVTFQAGGSGKLELLDDGFNASAYDGRISGFGQNTHQTIDLVNVLSGASVSATYAPANLFNASGTLIVSSGGTAVADIALVGHYTTANFKIGKDANGDVSIVDPPVAPGGAQSANPALFGNYIAASFVSGGGYANGSPTGASEPTQSALLAHSPHT